MIDITDPQLKARNARLTVAAGKLVSALHTHGAFVEERSEPGPFTNEGEWDRTLGSLGPLTLGWSNGYPILRLADSTWVYVDTPVPDRLHTIRVIWTLVDAHESSNKILAAVEELQKNN